MWCDVICDGSKQRQGVIMICAPCFLCAIFPFHMILYDFLIIACDDTSIEDGSNFKHIGRRRRRRRRRVRGRWRGGRMTGRKSGRRLRRKRGRKRGRWVDMASDSHWSWCIIPCTRTITSGATAVAIEWSMLWMLRCFQCIYIVLALASSRQSVICPSFFGFPAYSLTAFSFELWIHSGLHAHAQMQPRTHSHAQHTHICVRACVHVYVR